MIRLIIDKERIHPGGGTLALKRDEQHYLLQVHRLQVGDRLNLRDGFGGSYPAQVLPSHKLEYGERETLAQLEGTSIHLAFAPPKGRRVDLILEKGTELGAAAMHPVYTERTVRKLTPLKARWERVVEAAARQCNAAYFPELWQPLRFEQLLEMPFDGLRLIATPGASARIVDLLPSQPPQRVLVLSGPEGGFTSDELAAARQAGMLEWGLGAQVLRAETAPVVALTILRHNLSDLG